MPMRAVLGGSLFFLCLPGTVLAADGFLEREVVVVQALVGDQGSFGWAVSELGDLDGDGARDALTGAPFHTAGGENAGRAYVYSSGTGALLFEWTGEAGDALGYAVADAGDLDGDGLSEVVVGAPGFAGPGRVFLYTGASGELLHEFIGELDGASLGSAVAGAGDLDGDGVADLLLGAEGHSGAATAAGRVYAFSGATFAALWTRDGEAMNGFFGSGTAPLGDVDGDGTPDVVVGARGSGPMGTGRVYVLSGVDGSDLYPPREADPGGGNLGHFFVGGVGDLDGDGASEVYGGDYGDSAIGPASGKAYVWSGRTGELRFSFSGEQAGDGLGCGRGGGDADHDGVPDLAIGSYSASPGGVTSAGKITLFSGATGAPIRTITGTNPGHQIGFDVVSLGDVDGDASDDLVLSGANGNRVYIVAGLTPPGGGSTGSTGDSTGDPGASSSGAIGTGADTAAPTTGGATIGSSSGGSPGTDATTQGAAETGDGATGDGCGCRTGGPVDALALAALLVLRRRRRVALTGGCGEGIVNRQ